MATEENLALPAKPSDAASASGSCTSPAEESPFVYKRHRTPAEASVSGERGAGASQCAEVESVSKRVYTGFVLGFTLLLSIAFYGWLAHYFFWPTSSST